MVVGQRHARAERGRFDAGQPARPSRIWRQNSRGTSSFRYRSARRPRDSVRTRSVLTPGSIASELRQASHHQPGVDEEDERQRDFGDGQQVAPPLLPPAGAAGSAAFAETARDVGAGGLHAGVRPNSTVEASTATAAKASTAPSSVTARPAESARPAAATRGRAAEGGERQTRQPAERGEQALSTSSCDTMRRRPAPMAIRSAISRARPAPRISERFATFAHAISSTHTTAPNSTSRAGRTSPTSTSRSGRSATPNCAFDPDTLARAARRFRPSRSAPRRGSRRGPAAPSRRVSAVPRPARPRCPSATCRSAPAGPASRRRQLGQDADDRDRLAVEGDGPSDDGRVAAEAGLPERIPSKATGGRRRDPPSSVKSRPRTGRTPSIAR